MINYSLDSSRVHDTIVLENIISQMQKTKKEILSTHKNFILEDYEVYKANAGTLDKIKPDQRITTKCGEYLSKTYDSSPRDLGELKRTIKDSLPAVLRAKCPFCMISKHNTFDHYLGKGTYPEYSLFSYNLIPACSECNSKKSTKLLDEHGNRLFLHFIYDEIPDYPFLVYKLSVKNGRIVLDKIVLDFPENESRAALIKNHFSELNLFERLADEFDVMASTIQSEYEGIESTPGGIKKALRKRMRSLEENCGINYWETCFLRAIINSQEILALLGDN